MKVFLLAPRESWIVDRFTIEWYADNYDITVGDPRVADVIWLVADWAWDQLPYQLLKQKKVLTSVHHIVPDKFGDEELANFVARDEITDAYHVPCEKTAQQVRDILSKIGSNKTIHVRPFWVNESLWRPVAKHDARASLGLDQDLFYVGSFQRDTEGKDLVSPKLEKGPDQFCDIVIKLHSESKDVAVLLGGWRRQYVVNRLGAAGVPYVYKELPNFETIRKMYAALDMYVVAARYEGGPQSIVECAAMDVPIVSTDVGLAAEILDSRCIYNASDFSTFLSAKMHAKSDECRNYAQAKVSEHFRRPAYTYFRALLQGL